MFDSLRVGFFLAFRYIRHSSIWTTGLVVFVMMLTFLNLVFTSGILVGLVDGAVSSFRNQYSGDLIISSLPEKRYIDRSQAIISTIEGIPEVRNFSTRYVEQGIIEANYKRTINTRNLLPDEVGTEIAGIDPVIENSVTGLSSLMVEGNFLDPGDDDFVVLGANLLERFLPGNFGLQTLDDVFVGEDVRITLSGATKEYTVKGIIKSKADQVDRRVFMIDRELRKRIGRNDLNVDEIAIVLNDKNRGPEVKQQVLASGAGQYAQVRLPNEALGTFLDDIKDTFALLGNIIGSISLIVASITIFIVIFITAITRRKYIGILKGIGISSFAVEVSYIMLSVFYAVIGIVLGLLLLYGLLVPYFIANPINFPFSDGILTVTTIGTTVRVLMILLTTIVAGYIPARIIVGKNTLDAILGR